MKLTQKQLRKIIKEEKVKMLNEEEELLWLPINDLMYKALNMLQDDYESLFDSVVSEIPEDMYRDILVKLIDELDPPGGDAMDL